PPDRGARFRRAVFQNRMDRMPPLWQRPIDIAAPGIAIFRDPGNAESPAERSRAKKCRERWSARKDEIELVLLHEPPARAHQIGEPACLAIGNAYEARILLGQEGPGALARLL